MSEPLPHEPCRIIGVLDDGPRGLTPHALACLEQAELVIGGHRTLARFAAHIAPQAERRDLTGRLGEVPEWIRTAQARGRRTVVLATGDPLCHGIAAFLQARLCIENIEILPNVSTIQLACARLGLPWNDLKICSVHARDSGEWQTGADPAHGLYPLRHALEHHRRVGVFTSPANTPDRIARMLISEGLAEHWNLAVAERLCQPGERIVSHCRPSDAAGMRFAEPNVVLLWRSTAPPPAVLFGMADERFEQRRPDKGLITKREVRAVSLARLQLRRDSIVWDIGAGSGALGLEAARLCADGHVFAIEKNRDDVAIAGANQRRFGIPNYTLLHGRAPDGLSAWPDPDAVFIGGSGGELPALIAQVLARLKPHGTLVMNVVTFENLATAIGALKEAGVPWDVTQIQSARSRPLLDMHRLAAENPVWIVSAGRVP